MSIITDFIIVNDNKKIARLCLNNPNSLNAQTVQMVSQSGALLRQWADDETVVAVLIEGTGDKAFCAGGDIRGLYHAYDPSVFPNQVACEFFGTEYELCKQIKHYAKPVIVWANGIVMGGGMGIAMPASYRIATCTTMMAMPEVAIGLFPDAGGSFFLSRLPDDIGLFLGLTGARINASDALALGLVDYALSGDVGGEYERLIAALQAMYWHDDIITNHKNLKNTLKKLHNTTGLAEGWLLPHYDEIAQLMRVDSLYDFDTLAKMQTKQADGGYIHQALLNYLNGSPISAAITWRAYHQAKQMEFDAVMAMEFVIAVNCMHEGEFAEGVRALLIDKDKNPNWRYTLQTLPVGYIERYFQAW